MAFSERLGHENEKHDLNMLCRLWVLSNLTGCLRGKNLGRKCPALAHSTECPYSTSLPTYHDSHSKSHRRSQVIARLQCNPKSRRSAFIFLVGSYTSQLSLCLSMQLRFFLLQILSLSHFQAGEVWCTVLRE